jgi:ribonuclease BN (tRNA processing enzyme)
MQNTLQIIGCRAGSPDANQPASGYLLCLDGKAILIDCGPGVVASLAAQNLIETLDAVIITHAHADHCLDTVALAYHRLFPARMAPIPLYGLTTVGTTLKTLDELFGIPTLPELRHPLSQAMPFHTLKAGQSLIIADSIHVETHQTQHSTPTIALRFPDYGFAFTADAALNDALIDFVRGVPVLLAEATYPHTDDDHALKQHGHMTASQAGILAAKAGVEQLILTHLSDFTCRSTTLQKATAEFSGHIHIASPSLIVPLQG